MTVFKGFVIAATLASATGAFAGPTQLSDSQYLAMARCDGLASSPALGKDNASAIDAVFKAQGEHRLPEVTDQADEARSDAIREAGHAGPQGKAALVAERDGVCQAWVQDGGSNSASIAGHPNTN
jgi:hypothetical protein